MWKKRKNMKNKIQSIYKETGIEPPNDDLNDDIKKDYLEAASILNKSVRGAAAILRLALQKLMIQLGGRGKNFHDDFEYLVKKGMPLRVQKALLAIKVISKNAMYYLSYQIRVKELFHLFNYIAERMITNSKNKKYDNTKQKKEIKRKSR